MPNYFFASILYLAMAACDSPETKDATNSDSSTAPMQADSSLASPSPIATDTSSLEGQWFLQAVLSSDTSAGRIPSIGFKLSDNSFTGNTGCNRMSGKFQLTDSSLVFDERMITTKMACPGYNEDAFIKSLLRTNHYRFEDGVLILMIGTEQLSRWTRKPDRTMKPKQA
jgi:heat shock protein HslJ